MAVYFASRTKKKGFFLSRIYILLLPYPLQFSFKSGKNSPKPWILLQKMCKYLCRGEEGFCIRKNWKRISELGLVGKYFWVTKLRIPDGICSLNVRTSSIFSLPYFFVVDIGFEKCTFQKIAPFPKIASFWKWLSWLGNSTSSPWRESLKTWIAAELLQEEDFCAYRSS